MSYFPKKLWADKQSSQLFTHGFYVMGKRGGMLLFVPSGMTVLVSRNVYVIHVRFHSINNSQGPSTVNIPSMRVAFNIPRALSGFVFVWISPKPWVRACASSSIFPALQNFCNLVTCLVGVTSHIRFPASTPFLSRSFLSFLFSFLSPFPRGAFRRITP